MHKLVRFADARNTVEGKVLSVIMALLLMLSFSNVCAFTGQARAETVSDGSKIADGGLNASTSDTSEIGTTQELPQTSKESTKSVTLEITGDISLIYKDSTYTSEDKDIDLVVNEDAAFAIELGEDVSSESSVSVVALTYSEEAAKLEGFEEVETSATTGSENESVPLWKVPLAFDAETNLYTLAAKWIDDNLTAIHIGLEDEQAVASEAHDPNQSLPADDSYEAGSGSDGTTKLEDEAGSSEGVNLGTETEGSTDGEPSLPNNDDPSAVGEPSDHPASAPSLDEGAIGETPELPEVIDECLCRHHLQHDEACGGSVEGGQCSYICPICPVQLQIDSVLTQGKEIDKEALEPEAIKRLLAEAQSAQTAYRALSVEQQAEISGVQDLDALVSRLGSTEEIDAEQPEAPDNASCAHHPVHDESCGYTEDNPVCSFVCAICPVQRQVDDILTRIEQMNLETEELDEEATLQLYDDLLAVFHAYNLLEQEQREQITGIETLEMVLEALDIQPLAGDDAMKITTAQIKALGATDQSLSDNGSFSVDFSKQFTLHIAVESKLNLANKKVEITVPDGLTVVEYPIPERGGMAESVTPESIDKLNSANNYGGYHPTNGTITYSLKNTAEKNSFNIVLEPDTVLWNRAKEQTLENALKIRVYTDGADGKTYQELSATPKITGKYNDTVGDNRAIQTGPRLSRVGVKTGVPTAANQPFALRQIWINPDKDYIDMPQFFKKLEITIALPYYVKDGTNVYAELDHITWDPAGQSTRPNMLDPENHKDADDDYTYTETRNDTDHTVTLTWTNLYLEYGQDYFTPYFKWTSDCDVTTKDAVKWGSALILNTGKKDPGCYEGKTPTTGAASAVGGTITWQDDSTWYLYNGDCMMFSFTAQAGESMSVNGKANNQPIYNNYTSDSGITYYLGQFHVVNQGGAASADKTVEFTYGNNDKIGVTAQKIPASTGNTVEVWYTTTRSPSEQKYNGPLTSSGGFVAFTANMANLAEGEYFTKIKANVGSYEKDYVGYVSSRDQDPTSGYATTFGKLLTADEATYSNFASMKMYDTGSGDSTAKSGNYTVKVTNARGEIPLAMEQAYKEGTLERVPILSKTSATAGDTITFNGLLSSSAYPYSSNNVTTDQEIYIRLPEKIAVENLKLYQEEGRTADKVFLLDAVTETVTNTQRTEIPDTAYNFETVTSAEAGYKLYKITFTNQDNPAKVGWFTDGLGQYQIGISFDMNIAKDADAMTLDMRDCVRFKSASLTSTANNGTLAQYQVMDEGVRYSTFNVNAKGTKLSVVAARLGLTFTFGARMTEKGSTAVFDATKYSNFENDGEKVYLKDANHVVDMLFTLKNETGREFSEEDAQAFYYFIPVPEKDDFWDSHMQDQAFEFHMSLTRAPELQGVSAEHILVTYATDIESTATAGEAKHYTNTDNYMTEDKLLEGCTTEAQKAERWREVKMIRIAAKPDITSIPQNAELKVNMRLEPMFNENADLVGSEINFGPCGVSPYSVGNTPNQGHNPLPRIQVEFQTGIIAGKIFIDKNFNGIYDEGTDELYKGGVAVEANHSNGNENCTEGDAAHKTTATDGTFSFNGRRADTYHVTVTNPGSTDANGENPLKFSLPESGGKFSLDAGKNTATASVVLDMNKKPNDINDAGSLQIGFQQPHMVTFSVPNGQGGTTTKVWHGDKLGNVIPTVTANEGYRFTGNWTVGANTYTADQLKEVAISSDATFTAEVKKLYSLTYDLNGGSGAAAPATSTHIEGEKVKPDYSGTQNLKKGEKTIFVGWSETKIEKALPEDAAQADIDKIISTDEHTMPARNVILYAVYAVDANGNGNPDYNDNAVHVRYHGNNGVYTDILCPHHHVAGATAKLSTSGTVSGKNLDHDEPASAASGEVASHTFTYEDVTTGYDNIFIGWSTSPILDTIIKTKADYDGLASSIVTEVTMLAKPVDSVSTEDAKDTSKYADNDGNTNVYAVWAADRNGNKTADYLEEKKLIYDGNTQQGGTVTGTPTDNKIYIPGDKPTLSEDKPTHSKVDNKSIVFIGWTETKTGSIFSRDDTAPATVTEVTFGSANKTVYAAWGYDENGNGTADVLETYTLIYDLNSGKGAVPAKVSGIAKNTEITLTAEKNFTRNLNEIFVGWSETKRDAALSAETKQEDLEKFLIEPGASYRIGTADVTLYAVWAADANGNGKADYAENLSLTYSGNAQQGGTVTNLPTDTSIHIPDDVVTLSTAAPTHADVRGKKVVFIGWTETQTSVIFSRADTAPALVSEVTFGSANKTVYAAWGYDENNNGTPDVTERKCQLIYDGNAQDGDVTGVPNPDANHIEGDAITLSVAKPTHSEVDGKKVAFLGWTETRQTKIFTSSDTKPTCITEVAFAEYDITVYAAWAYDESGSGSGGSISAYTLSYDLNGGRGVAPEPQTGLMQGQSVALTTEKNFTRNAREVFVGWSQTQHPNAFAANQGNSIKQALITTPDIVIEDHDVVLYAVWAQDRNANGVADYTETRHLKYVAHAQKGGTVKNLPTDSKTYLPGEKATLSSAKPTHTNVSGKKVAFIGWTPQPTGKLYTGKDTAPSCVKQVTFARTDLSVYAAWGYDENGNGTADALETYSLTYNINGGKGQVPAAQRNLKQGARVTLATPANISRNSNEVFAGWSQTKHSAAFTEDQREAMENILIKGSTYVMGLQNVTLYAVWKETASDTGDTGTTKPGNKPTPETPDPGTNNPGGNTGGNGGGGNGGGIPGGGTGGGGNNVGPGGGTYQPPTDETKPTDVPGSYVEQDPNEGSTNQESTVTKPSTQKPSVVEKPHGSTDKSETAGQDTGKPTVANKTNNEGENVTGGSTKPKINGTWPSVEPPASRYPTVKPQSGTAENSRNFVESQIANNKIKESADDKVITTGTNQGKAAVSIAVQSDKSESCWVHIWMLIGLILVILYGVVVVLRRRRLIKLIDNYEDDVMCCVDETTSATVRGYKAA